MKKYHRLQPVGMNLKEFAHQSTTERLDMGEINQNQASHYQNKLQHEIDAWDLY